MKHTFLFFTFFCLLFNCYSQDSIMDYLNKNRKDFHQQKKIITYDVLKNDIVLLGENHGYKANYEVRFRLIKEYKEATDFKYLLAEMDWASSQKLNSYLLAEDTLALQKLIHQDQSTFAWCKERYQHYKKLIELNRQYQNKIQYIGVDITAGGIGNSVERVVEIMNKYQEKDSIVESFSNKRRLGKRSMRYIKKLYAEAGNKKYNPADLFEYNYHLCNIIHYDLAIHTSSYLAWDRVRDSCIFENYKKMEKHLHLEKEKMMGTWGTNHAYQRESEGVKWFASNLTSQLHKKVYTYKIFYFNSKSMFPEHFVPGLFKIFRSKKKLYYQVKYQNDDHFAAGGKLEIDKLRKASPKKSIVYYDLTQKDSPFFKHPYFVNYQNVNTATTDYFQTAIVFRNESPTEPFGKNRKKK